MEGHTNTKKIIKNEKQQLYIQNQQHDTMKCTSGKATLVPMTPEEANHPWIWSLKRVKQMHRSLSCERMKVYPVKELYISLDYLISLPWKMSHQCPNTFISKAASG